MITNKRGLSAVVVTLIMILLGVVVVGVLWVVISNVVSEGVEGITLGKFLVDLRIESAYVSESDIPVTISRGSDNVDLTEIQFIVFDGEESGSINKDGGSLHLSGKRTFTLTESELSNLGFSADSIEEVSVAPIYIEEGEVEETQGGITDTRLLGVSGGASSGGDDPGDSEDPVSSECTIDDDCEDPSEPYCIGETCVECVNVTHCEGEEICNNNVCVAPECTIDDDCTNSTIPYCEGDICVECVNNTHCEGDDVCDNNICVAPECVLDTDCESGEKCDNNVCTELCNGTWEGTYYNESVYECDGTGVTGCSSCLCDTGFTPDESGGCSLDDPINNGSIHSVWPEDGDADSFQSDDLPKSQTELLGYNTYSVNFTGSSETECFDVRFSWYYEDVNRSKIDLDVTGGSLAEIYPGEVYSIWEASNCGQEE